MYWFHSKINPKLYEFWKLDVPKHAALPLVEMQEESL
jgi:hypothetical protein